MTSHPTQSKERLINKILAGMMIHCSEKISDAKVHELQTLKHRPNEIDAKTEEHQNLLDFNLDKYKVDSTLSVDAQKKPIELSQQEVYMQTMVEVSAPPFLYFILTDPTFRT